MFPLQIQEANTTNKKSYSLPARASTRKGIINRNFICSWNNWVFYSFDGFFKQKRPCSVSFSALFFSFYFLLHNIKLSHETVAQISVFSWNKYKAITVYLFSSPLLMGFFDFLVFCTLHQQYYLVINTSCKLPIKQLHIVNHLHTGLFCQHMPSSVFEWMWCHQWLQADAYHAYESKHRT